MNKKDRQIVFDKYNGRCAYCGVDLTKSFHVDHIEPIIRNNGGCEHPSRDNADNYNPSCASCNLNKHSMSLESFRASIKKYVQSLNSYSTQYKIAKRYGLITENNIEVKFYFETLINSNVGI